MGAVITIYQRSITKLTASIHDCIIFLLSLSLPLTIFALPYGLQGQLDLLWHGLFELPSSRLDQATALPPLGIWALGSIPLIALVLFSGRLPQSMSLPLTVTVALAGASIVILSSTPIIYQAAFLTVQSSLSAICILVWFHSKRDNADVSVVIVAIVAASMGLTQYPYSSGIYFCYCAPLAGLTLTVRSVERSNMINPCGPALHWCWYYLVSCTSILRIPDELVRSYNNLIINSNKHRPLRTLYNVHRTVGI